MFSPANKRVCEVAAINCPTTSAQAGYKTAAPGGPAGSALFTFAAVFEALTPGLSSTYNNIFNRWNAANGGWWMRSISTATNTTPMLVECGAHNAAAGFVSTTLLPYALHQTMLVIGRWNSGTMQQWLNGVAGSPITSGVGFSSAAVATMIGTNGAAASSNARSLRISECVFLDTYDAQASYSTSFGVGVPGLYAQWAEDLQQGRYLTCPVNAGVWPATSAYWSSRDVVQGVAAKATWLDRSTNLYSMARTGVPQGTSIVPRLQ